MKRVVIRTDASNQLGAGHVMRCLGLADALKAKGGEVSFISRKLEGDLFHTIQERGYEVNQLDLNEAGDDKSLLNQDARETVSLLKSLDQPVDWLIVDHYKIDASWEKEMLPMVKKIMVIDGLKNRPHECHLILDPNENSSQASFADQVPASCRQLSGFKYALLRDEFLDKRKSKYKTFDKVKRLLITFGGGDVGEVTLKAIHAVLALQDKDLEVTVVMGQIPNKGETEIRKALKTLPHTNVLSGVKNMAELMAQSDLAIAAGGMTKLELCVLGVPSIIVTVADNQIASTQTLHDQGALIYLGNNQEVSRSQITETVRNLINHPETRIRLSETALSLVDGEGIHRVCEELAR